MYVPQKRTTNYSLFRLYFVRDCRLLPLFTPPRSQHAHFEPHHHSVAVQPHWTRSNTSTTLVTRPYKTSYRIRDRTGKRFTIQHIDGDIFGSSRTGEKAFVATNTGMQFLPHLGHSFV